MEWGVRNNKTTLWVLPQSLILLFSITWFLLARDSRIEVILYRVRFALYDKIFPNGKGTREEKWSEVGDVQFTQSTVPYFY